MKKIKLNSELHIDNEADAAYLYLNSWKESKVSHTSCLFENDNWNINIDYNENWEIIWIEFLPASKYFK